MSPGDQGTLRAIFIADSELRDHYREWLPSYRVWAAKLCNFRVSLPGGGGVLEFDEDETVARLADMIRKGDEPLGTLMHLPKTRKNITLSHTRICELFAMNVVAREPVSAT